MFNLLFVGDVVLADASYQGQSFLSEDLKKIFSQYEVLCCNLEGPVLKGERKPVKKAGPTVKNGSLSLQRLEQAGFNLIALANNHILDYGNEGLKDTLQFVADEYPEMKVVGAGGIDGRELCYCKTVDCNGIRVAIINVAESANGCGCGDNMRYMYMLDERVKECIEAERMRSHYTIVMCHCGAEGIAVPLPEVKMLYHQFVEWGADFVIGNHPHVVQGTEEYRGKHIIYSLGNFAFDSLNDSNKAYNPDGMAIGIHLTEKSSSWEMIPTRYGQGTVEIGNIEPFQKSCNILNDKNKYDHVINEYCIDFFTKYYISYCCQAIGFHDKSILQRVKMAWNLLSMRRIKYDLDFIYHNVANDTNRWACKRAIELIK